MGSPQRAPSRRKTNPAEAVPSDGTVQVATASGLPSEGGSTPAMLDIPYQGGTWARGPAQLSSLLRLDVRRAHWEIRPADPSRQRVLKGQDSKMGEKIARVVIRLTAVARCDGGLRGRCRGHAEHARPMVPPKARRRPNPQNHPSRSIHPAALPPPPPHAHTSALGRRAHARAHGGYYFWRVREHTRPTRNG